MAGVAQHQEDEAAGYIASTVRDHKGVDAGAQLPLSLFFQFYSTQTCAVIQKQRSQPSMDEKNETCQTLNCNKFIQKINLLAAPFSGICHNYEKLVGLYTQYK